MAPATRDSRARTNSVAGVDAGRIGDEFIWVMAVTGASDGSRVEFVVHGSFRELWSETTARELLIVAVDMPMGLPTDENEWRTCETEARKRLGPERRQTVFQSPPRWIVNTRDPDVERRWASRVGQKNVKENPRRLLDRCREVREVLDPAAFREPDRPRAAEVHAEVCFWKLNNEQHTRIIKRDRGGPEERLKLLRPQFSSIEKAVEEAKKTHGPNLHQYDLLDAAAAAWTARRISSGIAEDLGDDKTDADRYPMKIWM